VESPDDTSHHGVRLQGSQPEVVTALSLAFDIPTPWQRLSDAAMMLRDLHALSGNDRRPLFRIGDGEEAQWVARHGGSVSRHLLSQQHGCYVCRTRYQPFRDGYFAAGVQGYAAPTWRSEGKQRKQRVPVLKACGKACSAERENLRAYLRNRVVSSTLSVFSSFSTVDGPSKMLSVNLSLCPEIGSGCIVACVKDCAHRRLLQMHAQLRELRSSRFERKFEEGC
jgi:hypothetical protein